LLRIPTHRQNFKIECASICLRMPFATGQMLYSLHAECSKTFLLRASLEVLAGEDRFGARVSANLSSQFEAPVPFPTTNHTQSHGLRTPPPAISRASALRPLSPNASAAFYPTGFAARVSSRP
jgi:hypothetical protein